MTSDITAYRLQDNVGFLLRVCQQKTVASFAAHAPDVLSARRFATLAALVDADKPTPQNQLGRMIAADAATIKGIVDRLQALGAVDVSANPSDRRQRLVILTDSGRALYEEGVKASVESSRIFLGSLSSHEAAELVGLLRKAGLGSGAETIG